MFLQRAAVSEQPAQARLRQLCGAMVMALDDHQRLIQATEKAQGGGVKTSSARGQEHDQ